MILIVDDDYDIASLINISLKKAGFIASVFTEPLAALEEFALHPADYNLVISDIMMSGIDGYQLAQQIKKIKPDVKILLTSAFEYDDRYYTTGLPRLDLAGFIEKPISMSELLTVVFTVLDNNTAAATQQHSQNVHIL